jgi:preprotein translocase subunit SecD
MDRSLKWRTLGLFALVVLCVGILLPTVVTDLPGFFPFKRPINLGLDLKGGLHIVYKIDLNTAIADRASEIERTLRAEFADDATKLDVDVKTPLSVLGGVTVIPKDKTKLEEVKLLVTAKVRSAIEPRDCEAGLTAADAYCFKISQVEAEAIRNTALDNALTTIRERVDASGVAEPSVVRKGEQIIVEIPGLSKDRTEEMRELIASSAKLEFKVVDDGTANGVPGQGTAFMSNLFAHVGQLSDKDIARLPEAERAGLEPGMAADPVARAAGVRASSEQWNVEETGQKHGDFFLYAEDREDQVIPVAEAEKPVNAGGVGCLRKSDKVEQAKVVNGMYRCKLPGSYLIAKYVADLAATDPRFKIPDDHQLGFEYVEPAPGSKTKAFWRSYYLFRAVRLTGTTIVRANGVFDPTTNRALVTLEFDRTGTRVFGDLTTEIVGQRLATILDGRVKSAPTINQPIRGGHAQIQMGGRDPDQAILERDKLVQVLRTGSLPAPLTEETTAVVGPTLGRDAIDKTKVSFGIGVLLVVLIMVGIYRWSGWISVFAVIFHNLLTIAVMALLGATLTLPGIAAIVLSVGMTVDGNILIYERIRDELNLGKSVRGAVDLGFSRAFSAILDGQLTTAVAGFVLLLYGSGPIRGFATLLLVGVFTTITTNIWVTRIFFDWYITKKKGQMATISI